MKDYASMSDFEINSAVHNALLDKPYELAFHGDGKITWKDKERGGVWETGIVQYTKNGLHDYCNNPEDAWPIINASRISIMFDGTDPQYEGWHHEWCDAISSCQKFGIQHQSNPLRAAMIVFLMMKESEND